MTYINNIQCDKYRLQEYFALGMKMSCLELRLPMAAEKGLLLPVSQLISSQSSLTALIGG